MIPGNLKEAFIEEGEKKVSLIFFASTAIVQSVMYNVLVKRLIFLRNILISCDQNANQIKQLCSVEFKVKLGKAWHFFLFPKASYSLQNFSEFCRPRKILFYRISAVSGTSLVQVVLTEQTFPQAVHCTKEIRYDHSSTSVAKHTVNSALLVFLFSRFPS